MESPPIPRCGTIAASAIANRLARDFANNVHVDDGHLDYNELRYPSGLVRILDHHFNDKWFGYTFDMNTLKVMVNELQNKVFLPFQMECENSLALLLALQSPALWEYWAVVKQDPHAGRLTLHFQFQDYVMGQVGVFKIADILNSDIGDTGGAIYDPGETGKVMLDVELDQHEKEHLLKLGFSRYATMTCVLDDHGQWMTQHLCVGDPENLDDIKLPVSDERCNARAVTLKQALDLGFEYCQISQAVSFHDVRKNYHLPT